MLTPIAKAFSTDIGDETTSIGVQVHGGMGFIEETGAAQHMRDSRIAAIYEGANGIHAIDLVQRKLPLAGGETVAQRDRAESASRRATSRPKAARASARRRSGSHEAADALEEIDAPDAQLARGDPNSALAGRIAISSPVRAHARRRVPGQGGLAAEALAAGGDESELGRVGLARFFAEKLAVAAPGLARAIASGGAPLEPYETILAESA